MSTAIEKAKAAVESKPKVMTIQELIESSSKALGKALPAHMNAERLTRIALTTLRLNPSLYQCEPMSFLAALFQSAQLGLEPNVNGESWIIPYQNKGMLCAQFQVGYLGWIKLFYNHQASVSIQMETVFQYDQFSCDIGANKLSHVPPPFGQDRGKVIGYYAIASLKNGGRMFKVMSRDEAERFAKRFSKCYRGNAFIPGTPWAEHFDAMAMKTVLKQLIKELPKSVEIQHALALDETVKTHLSGDMVEIPDETDYTKTELPAPAGDEQGEHEAAEAPKSAPSAMPSASAAKVSAVDVKIHELKRELNKLLKSDDFYYTELGKMGCEHLTDLKPLDKEVFLKILKDRWAEVKK